MLAHENTDKTEL